MFSENTEKSDEQSLNSLMSTSPTVLDDSETSILRSLPTDANMTITTSDKEESATRSVETLPAGNLVDPTRNDDTIVYRSLSLSTAGPTLLAPEARNLDSSLIQGFGSLGGRGQP